MHLQIDYNHHGKQRVPIHILRQAPDLVRYGFEHGLLSMRDRGEPATQPRHATRNLGGRPNRSGIHVGLTPTEDRKTYIRLYMRERRKLKKEAT